MSISESNPFLSACRSEEPSLSGDSFLGGGAWNKKNNETSEVKKGQKRGQKIKKLSNCRKEIVAINLCPTNSTKTNSTTHMDKGNIYPP
jgi:hypothetical protein